MVTSCMLSSITVVDILSAVRIGMILKPPYSRVSSSAGSGPGELAFRYIRRFGDLIRYQNDGQDRTAIVGNAERA